MLTSVSVPGPPLCVTTNAGHLAESVAGLLNLLILDLLFINDGDGHAELAERL